MDSDRRCHRVIGDAIWCKARTIVFPELPSPIRSVRGRIQADCFAAKHRIFSNWKPAAIVARSLAQRTYLGRLRGYNTRMTLQPGALPNPGRIMETLNAYQQTQALKAAIELGLFTQIADGAVTPADIAGRIQASERGVRILCDYLTIIGYLTKGANGYALSQEAATFLNKRSPAYLGSIAFFLTHESITSNFADVASVVRKGGALSDATLTPEDPVWVEFAKSMAPFVAMVAGLTAKIVSQPGRAIKVLDIAAGHGLFGIMVTQHNPKAEIVAQDWANVLQVAAANAAKFGVADRFRMIPGSAFDADLESGYDVILLPNFLHHFDEPAIVGFLKKIRAALKPDGLVATVEFVPNEDRVSPPLAASFGMMMLGGTPAGDAYTLGEYERMFRAAGFGTIEQRSLDPTPQTLILSRS
jgi:2-polyprenyl-3-methyl-5-hydroxy-6-metoxy-1,4-benzoquinol methylase